MSEDEEETEPMSKKDEKEGERKNYKNEREGFPVRKRERDYE